MKLNYLQFSNFKDGLESAIDQLKDGTRANQLTASVLAEVYKKAHGQSLFPKPKYSVKLTDSQKIAVVQAIGDGLFADHLQMSITSGNIMMELHRQLPTPKPQSPPNRKMIGE